MAGVTNAVGVSFQELATQFLTNLQTSMNNIVGAEITFLKPILTAMLIMFVGRQFFMLMTGNMTIQRFIDSIAKALLIIFLVGNAANFTQRIVTPVFTTIPQALSAMVLNTDPGLNITSADSVATQFDKASTGADAVTSQVVSMHNHWTVHDIEIGLAARAVDALIQISLAVMCFTWMLGQEVLAIILCFGAPLLLFELFDRTRGWVNQWIGKIVGAICFGFGTAILLGIEMNYLLSMEQSSYNAVMANGTEALSLMFQILATTVIQALTMVSLPVVCAFGSGVAASMAAPAAFALANTAAAGRSLGGLAVQTIQSAPSLNRSPQNSASAAGSGSQSSGAVAQPSRST